MNGLPLEQQLLFGACVTCLWLGVLGPFAFMVYEYFKEKEHDERQ